MGRAVPGKKEGKEEILKNFVETSREALHGLSSEGVEASRDLVEKMVTMGRITEDQAQILMRTLVDRVQRSRELFETRVSTIVTDVITRLEAIATEELKELETRLEKVERTGSGKAAYGSPAPQLR